MMTSPYTEYLRHHLEAGSAHSRSGRRHTDRLLAPWRRHRVYNPSQDPTSADPQSR